MKYCHYNTKARGLQYPRKYRGVIAACLWMAMALVNSSTAVAQQELNQTTVSQVSSKKEQVARGLEALRAAHANQDVSSQPLQSKGLFLDLTTESSAIPAESESSQASAATLNVSMKSSPTQVLMRAVAWIAIILCVCCLAVLAARRWQRERGLLPTTTSRSRVMETLSLGPGRTVSLIEMHGYRALVATDAGGIRSLVLAPSTFEESLMQEEEITNEQV